MKIAIDVSPLSSGHSIRGVGFYVKNLLQALRTYHPEHEYIEFVKLNQVPKDVDIVHYPYFDPFFHTLPFFPRNNTVVTVHDMTPLLFPELFPIGIKGKVQWFFQKRSLKKVAHIITDSHASKADIIKILQIDAKKIDSVYLAAGEQFGKTQDMRYKIQVREKYHLPETFALYVGDGTPNKNLPHVVKAMLRTRIPLFMVGKSLVDESLDESNAWTKDIQEVRRLQAANASQIHFLGFIPDEDLVALYNIASVFVMPSLYEGFGLPILEAFSCGCPVVTSNKGSLREVAGSAACIVDPRNIDHIAEAVQKVVGNKQFAKNLFKKGLEQAKKFSWKKTSDETVHVYEKTFSK